MSLTLPSHSSNPADTVVVSVRVPIAVSIEINKVRVTERSTNSTVVTTLLMEALAARAGVPVASVAPAAPAARGPKAKAKKDEPGPPYVMKNPSTSLVGALRGAKPLQVSATRAPAPAVEVTVSDSVSVQDVAEPAVVAAPVAHEFDDPFSEFLDDDAIDIAALAAIDDEEPPVLDPFKLVT